MIYAWIFAASIGIVVARYYKRMWPNDKHCREKVSFTVGTLLPAKSDSDFMFCLQSYQGLIIDRSRVY